MTVKHAILGLLSWKPLTGYDLKRIFSDSSAFYWSGNNNQVYRTLLELFEEGLVAREVVQQENLPAKKIYSISEKGRQELRQWLISVPDLPLFRHSFLVQLAWADALSDQQLEQILDQYQEDIYAQYLIHKARIPQLPPDEARTPREAILWTAVHQNRISFYLNELEWINNLRGNLKNAAQINPQTDSGK